MRRFICVLICLLLVLPLTALAQGEITPRLMVESVSPYNGYPGYVAGRVFNESGETLNTEDYVVAVFVFTTSAGDDSNGYIKPTNLEPFTRLGEDGAFLTLTTTDHYGADNDRKLLEYRVLLLPADATQGQTYSQTAKQALDELTVIRATDGTYTVNYDCGFPTPAHFPQMELVWSDEFDGDEVDTSKWNVIDDYGYDQWYWSYGSEEYYTSENVTVEDGLLTLTASYTGTAVKTGDGSAWFASGCVNTKDIMSITGGRIEIRARCDVGDKLRPCVWMLPQPETEVEADEDEDEYDYDYEESDDHSEWPKGGELDIWESNGSLSKAILQQIQFSNLGWDTVSNNFKGEYLEGTMADWHTYAVEWTMGGISWYVDGMLTFGANHWVADEGSNPAPFDQPFYLIMNFAVGGDPFTMQDDAYLPDDSVFYSGDKNFQVDYVRVYQMK